MGFLASTRKRLAFAGLIGIALQGYGVNAAASLAYHTCDYGSTLCATNTVSGVNTAIGSFGIGGTYGNAFNTSGVMYATAGSSSLATVNLSTGAATVFAALPTFGYAIDFDTANRLFFYATNGHLYRLNASTGAVLSDVATGLFDVMDFGFDDQNNLYAVNGDNKIYTINALTGAIVTSVATPNANLMGLMIDENNGVWVTQHQGNAAMLRINMTTGAVAQSVSSVNGPHGGDIFVANDVPLPPSIALVGLALLALPLSRRQAN